MREKKRDAAVHAAVSLARRQLREGRPDEAAISFAAASRLLPDSPSLWSDLGVSLNQAGRRKEAVASYETALKLAPTHTNSYNNLAVALQADGDADGASSAYRHAAQLMTPPSPVVQLNLLRSTLEAARWQHWPLLEWLAARDTNGSEAGLAEFGRGEWPWARLEARAFLTGVPARLHGAARREARAVTEAAARPWPCDRDCSRGGADATRVRRRGPLRLALLSNLDADPSASLLTAALPLLHDRRRGLSLSLLSLNDRPASGPLLSIARAVPTVWLPAQPPSIALGAPPPACEAQEALGELAPHIVLEAMGYLPGQRLDLLARRCTRPPITLSMLRNFHGSMGGRPIDYALADRASLPPQAASDYREAVLLLPHHHLVNAHAAAIRDLRRGRRHSLWPTAGVPVACSLNRLNKLDPSAFSTWLGGIARTRARLWVATGAGGKSARGRRRAHATLRSEAAARGVHASRVLAAGRASTAGAHLARVQSSCDVSLDTRVWGAHTTALDSLAAAVGVVSVRGAHPGARTCHSLQNAIGTPALSVGSLRASANLIADLLRREPSRDARADLSAPAAVREVWREGSGAPLAIEVGLHGRPYGHDEPALFRFRPLPSQ